ncbi:MAG TPA: hypothetical protein VFW83_05330 [Bryobacteraceae bacterium]|nr:hypothetical protein [Bryobacteraceae bacterium]
MGDGKLYIYDSTSRIDRWQASGRFSKNSGVTTVPAGSAAELQRSLADLVAKGQTFNKVVFQTHGNSGMIFFNHVPITASDFRSSFAGKGYDRLFPRKTKIYFDGCVVAQGSAGWDFLVAAGETFLRGPGGLTMAYTSVGSGIPGWVPLIGGHTEHFTGNLRLVEFKAGGAESNRFESNGSIPDLIKQSEILSSYN